jgi:predicted small lipoprotein YifL
LKQRQAVSLFIFGTVLLALMGCGKKGPPFMPKEDMPLKVKHLTGEWKNGDVFLKGHIATHKGKGRRTADVLGCRVYGAHYDLENPPCEGCPIEYRFVKELKADVISGDEFYCQVPNIMIKGFHLFKVHLLGRKGTLGPPSNGVRLVIDDRLLSIEKQKAFK